MVAAARSTSGQRLDAVKEWCAAGCSRQSMGRPVASSSATQDRSPTVATRRCSCALIISCGGMGRPTGPSRRGPRRWSCGHAQHVAAHRPRSVLVRAVSSRTAPPTRPRDHGHHHSRGCAAPAHRRQAPSGTERACSPPRTRHRPVSARKPPDRAGCHPEARAVTTARRPDDCRAPHPGPSPTGRAAAANHEPVSPPPPRRARRRCRSTSCCAGSAGAALHQPGWRRE